MDRGYSGKRSDPLYEEDMVERNGRQKRRNQGGCTGGSSREPQHFVPRNLPVPDVVELRILCPSHDVVLRILCPLQKIDSIMMMLRQDSGANAKIEIADAIPGVDDRIIINWSCIIFSSSCIFITSGCDRDSRHRGCSRERDGGKEEDWKDRESSHPDGEKFCAAQEVLFQVPACIGETLGGASDHEEDPSEQVVTRLLVPNNQIGCLLGKGGKIIEQMRQSTGAQIRVLPKDQLPACAMATDELVQVSGDTLVLKKALLSIASRLQDNPPRDRLPSFASPAPASVPVNDYLPPPRVPYCLKGDLMGLGSEHLKRRDAWAMRGGSLPLDRPDGRHSKEGRDVGKIELVYRLLCPNDKIGSVIGMGGGTICYLREETGARIKINDVVPGSDERVIIVSAFELPGDSFSPTLEAVIQVQRRITAEIGRGKDGIVTTRLLVPINQIGCLLGKGGSIIEDMRRATRANIRVLPKDNLPRCATDTDDLVQIVGNRTVVREALSQVISRLRNKALRASVNKPVRGGGRGCDYGHSMPSLSMTGDNFSSPYDFGGRMGSISPSGEAIASF